MSKISAFARAQQKIETLINEEAYLFAKYLRNERKEWNPRLPTMRR